ncbi:2-hydroxyacid dehydrogenase [Streptomyces diastaticus]|uniref:Dehydrogenase n=3 Tax=Streptomyces TaxID=1883 RepID=A0A8H9HVD6_9ACTN|nr:2-hydroxyacid dehydrogenase [Streptomyces sp. ADI98-12]NEE45008.1 2-hydroxyacid dehydrogenase [Streptomyces sp. SID8455]QNE82833.1 phosphoglycerate dehydrogenase [Streptomyces rutgersensis]GFH80490.1 dehydrogenase [Streptomyces gougerotii]RPK88854.1 putative 2-hydroxyacid dehydrogenase [Streptomyces sp. ADI98-12]GGU88484.1 dehydrogenase [Streptomyces gougerotii]
MNPRTQNNPENFRSASFPFTEKISVWLPTPESEALMGGLPTGFRADVWTGEAEFPASADTVEVIIPPYGVGADLLSRFAELPRLRLLQLESAGVEWIRPYVPEGVVLCNAKGAYDRAVTEWVTGVVLAHLLRLPRFEQARRDERWDYTHTDSLEGKRVLLVGYGSLGSALAPVLAGFGAEVAAVARRARPGVHGVDELPGLLPEADIVVLLLPLTEATTGLVDATFLSRIRDGGLLVNAGRGRLVDTDALVAELRGGRLYAALDVTAPEPLPAGHPLWSAPGLILTPHTAGSNTSPPARAMALAKAQLARYAAGEPLANVVGEAGY